jgi:hypothetical protein
MGVSLDLVFGGLQRVEHHVGVFLQVIADNRFDRLVLLGGKLGGDRRDRRQERDERAEPQEHRP